MHLVAVRVRGPRGAERDLLAWGAFNSDDIQGLVTVDDRDRRMVCLGETFDAPVGPGGEIVLYVYGPAFERVVATGAAVPCVLLVGGVFELLLFKSEPP